MNMIDKLRKRLKRHKLDGLLVTRLENIRYLSGYTGEGVLLVTPDKALLATDFRYWAQAERQAPGVELYQVVSRLEPVYPGLLAAAQNPHMLGFESTHVTVAEHQKMLGTEGVKWVATTDMVEALRRVKGRSELALIQRAAKISDAAQEDLRSWLKPGMTEQEVAWKLEAFMRTHGAEDIAFDVIVAAGPGGAEAHHEPGERPIQSGEPIIVDIGARVEGYCSDITRTFCLGRQDKRFRKIYNLVLRAQEAALNGIKAGMAAQQADSLARDVFVSAGFGKEFGHSLGHGVGLAVHESPFARQKSEEVLPSGATLTIEPGLYFSDWGGVRIEDLVVIRKNGVKLLSHASKDPLI